MVREDRTKREVVVRLLAEVENRVHQIGKALSQEIDNTGELDSTFKSGRDAASKTYLVEIFKLMRWLKEDYFGISGNPKAYTDAEIDVIDIDIRTEDDE